MRSHALQVPSIRYEVDCELTMPGSKSHANRAIICAALSHGTTLIKNATPCDDVLVMVSNLRKMGFRLEWINRATGELKVHGGIPTGEGRKGKLDCHNAGTALRFLTSVAALVPGHWTITGNRHMLKRPIGDLVHALKQLGVRIRDKNGSLPLEVEGGLIIGSKIQLKADVSSQYLTSLLLIAPALPQGLTIDLLGPLASSGYVQLTRKVMSDFGVSFQNDGNKFTVPARFYQAPRSYEVEGDWSAAGSWMVLEALTGSSVRFTNLSRASEQSDRLLPGVIDSMKKPGDMTVDVSEIPDQMMNLSVLAAFRNGKTTFTGARNLRHKECDRLHVTKVELSKAGVNIVEFEDGVTVTGAGNAANLGKDANPIVMDPHNDHRMAMCFATLGLLRPGVSIHHHRCVAKSYPQFFADLRYVLSKNKPIALIGMRGVGKSNLARRLASSLRIKVKDTDQMVKNQHGVVVDYIEKHGVEEFRKRELDAVREAIKPGFVVSLGGGAIETPEVRELLKKHTICIWLNATEEEVVRRLKEAKRPRASLTGLPMKEEIAVLTERRLPLYKECSSIEIDANEPWDQHVPSVISTMTKRLRERSLHS